MDVRTSFDCEPIALLSGVPLFAGLEPEQLADLACRVRQAEFREGEMILRRDEPGDCLYVIHEGRVRIELPSHDGPPVVLRVLEQGEFFGELALLDGAPRSADAVAVEPCRLQLLQRADFRAFLMAHPEVPFRLLAALTRLLRHNAEIIEDAAFLDIPARLARVLLQLAASRPEGSEPLVISSRLTQANLAGLVGATRESVNRWLRFFERQGIIRAEGGQITILRPDALRRRIY